MIVFFRFSIFRFFPRGPFSAPNDDDDNDDDGHGDDDCEDADGAVTRLSPPFRLFVGEFWDFEVVFLIVVFVVVVVVVALTTGVATVAAVATIATGVVVSF